MKTIAALMILTVAASAADVAPEAFPATRYAKLAEAGAFAIATPVAAPEPKAPEISFAQGWHVTGVMKVPVGGNLVDRVNVLTAENKSFSLVGKEERDGVSIADINWSSKVGATTVTLKKGTEFATVEFNNQAPPPAARGNSGGAPAAPNGPPQGQPGRPSQPNHVLIPRPAPFPQNNAPTPPAGGVNRHAQRYLPPPGQ